MKLRNTKWLHGDVQELINPPPIPLIGESTEKLEEFNIINIRMLLYPALATSKTYELKVPTFENGKPEGFLQMMKYPKTTTNRTGTTSATRKNIIPTYYDTWGGFKII